LPYQDKPNPNEQGAQSNHFCWKSAFVGRSVVMARSFRRIGDPERHGDLAVTSSRPFAGMTRIRFEGFGL